MTRFSWWAAIAGSTLCIASVNVIAINPITSWLVNVNGSTELFHKGKLHRLPSNFLKETISSLFGNNEWFPPVPVTNTTNTKSWAPVTNNIPLVSERGEDIPALHIQQFNLDELLRINVASIFAMQNKQSLFHGLSDMGPYVNPSLLYFQGRWLMTTGASWSFPGMMDGRPESNTLYFKWLTHVGTTLSDKSTYLQKLHIPSKNRGKKPVVPAARSPSSSTSTQNKFLGLSTTLKYIQDIAISGQDPRFLVISDDLILVSFTFPDRFVRPGVALLSLNHSTNSLQVRHIVQNIHWNNSNIEKNWVPFYFEDSSRLPCFNNIDNFDKVTLSLSKALFIQQINPMVVVYIASTKKLDNEMSFSGHASLVSKAPRGYFSYRYGELRGGSNAVDLGDRYLAIFHSSVTLPRAATKTYFMGAFTFTKTFPFRLLSISSEPIILPWMYEGEWNPFYRNRKIDYCVFPVSLSFLPTKEIQSKMHHSTQNHTNATNNQYAHYHPHQYRRTFVRVFHPSATIHVEETSEEGNPSSHYLLHRADSELVWDSEADDDVSLLMTMGFQDLGGIATILSLKELYATMEPVIYCDDMSSRQHQRDLFDFYCVD